MAAVLAVTAAGVAAVPSVVPEFYADLTARYHRQPAIDAPETVDIGSVAVDSPVVALFGLANTGYGPLTVSDVRTSCACVGLERKVGDSFAVVREVTLTPGERGEFALRYRAAGTPGQQSRTLVRFRTTDPNLPEASVAVAAKLTGGLSAHPPQVVFPTVEAGRPQSVRVEVWDGAERVQPIGRVTAFHLEGGTATFTPHPAADRPRGDGGVLVGHLDMALKPQVPGEIDGWVEVVSADAAARPLRISVRGRSVGLVRLAPSQLRVPVRTSDGPSYTARCMVRPGLGAGGVAVVVASAPDALAVAVEDAVDGGPAVVAVTVRETFRRPTQQQHCEVRLAVTVGGRSEAVLLPVTIDP